jgi:hypothetical protein
MPLATESDACREFAANVGSYDRYKNSQWILTSFDTWERNPHYMGPDRGHPEDDDWGPDDPSAIPDDDSDPIEVYAGDVDYPSSDDDLPF